MRHLFRRITLAVAAATIINPVQAQIVLPAPAPPPWPPGTYSSNSFPYLFPAPTPEDAYREGLINRWKYEQLGAAPDGDAGTEPRWLSRRRR